MNKPSPIPAWAMKFLAAVCPKDLLEEIEGDVLQKYERNTKTFGASKAKRRLLRDVIGYAHPAILIRNKFSSPLIPFDMISNYFKIAWRSMTKSKFYSALNLAGLTLGLAVGLLILLWVNNELNYDSFNTKRDQLYQMSIHLQSNGEKFAASVVQAPIGPIALREVTGVENVVRVTTHDH